MIMSEKYKRFDAAEFGLPSAGLRFELHPLAGTARRRRLVLLLAVGATVALAGCRGEAAGSSAGGCEAPRVIAEQAEASPGERLEISGTGFFDGCVDTSANGTPEGDMSPYATVAIVVTQDGSVVVEQVAVPVEPDGTFETTLVLPEDLSTEPITITAPDVAGTEPLVLTISAS